MTVFCITTTIPGRPCTVRGFHLTDVDGTVHYSRPGVECTGCMPRPAEVGLLCRHCWERFEHALALAFDLIPHLRSIEKGPADVVGVRSAPGSRVILPASWIEADNLWSHLAVVAMVHSYSARVPEPDWPACTAARAGRHRFANDATVDEVRAAVRDLHDWVAATPRDVVARTGGASTAVEFFRATQRALKMFPLEDQARRMRFIRCRTCQQESLRLEPPLYQPDDPTLVCSNRECGAEWDPTLAGFDMLDLARTVAAERGIAMAELERDIAELLRTPASDEAEPLCWTHARGLPPHLIVRKVNPVEQKCVRCGIKTESGLYRRVVELENAA